MANEIDMVLYTASDIGFMAENVEGDENVTPVGTMTMAFRNCNHGEVSFEFTDGDLLLEEGDFPIKRISSIYRQRCSGGISDDTPSDRKPLQMDVSLRPVVEDGEGEGKAKLWERSDRSDFKVEVEDIPDGTYFVQICGVSMKTRLSRWCSMTSWSSKVRGSSNSAARRSTTSYT